MGTLGKMTLEKSSSQ